MKETIKVINELKKKKLIKDYTIGGGIATIYYIEPIFTYDLDVFIIPSEKKGNIISLSSIFAYLESKGYYWKGEHIIIEGVPTQFIPVDKLEEEAVRNAKEISYEGAKTKVMTPEHLIAVLLRAGRKKDIEKIEKLLAQTEINKKKLENILHRHGLSEKFKLL